jgi:uroporphyrinogen-III synthase
MTNRLSGTRILILEAREEAQFSRLLTEQGADVLQCPMFTIRDAPDPAPVENWIRRCIESSPDDLVLTTGEGLRRLIEAAQRMGQDHALITAISKSRTVARGPKPGKALREIGLDVAITTDKPTSEGIAATLAQLDLAGHRVGLQLYPDRDHSALIGKIAAQGAAVDPVLPYIYDASAAETNIVHAIEAMAAGRVDAIALTSSGQVRRLVEVARIHRCEQKLRAGLDRTKIAAVGPVVSEELASYRLRTDIMPANDAFFMKPLISAMAASLNGGAPLPRT